MRAIGHSNFSGDQARHAEAAAEELGTARFVSAQNEYNLLSRGAERDILPAAAGARASRSFPSSRSRTASSPASSPAPSDRPTRRISRQRPHVADDAPWDAIEAYAAYCADRNVTMLASDLRLAARPSRPRERHRRAPRRPNRSPRTPRRAPPGSPPRKRSPSSTRFSRPERIGTGAASPRHEAPCEVADFVTPLRGPQLRGAELSGRRTAP